MKIFVGWDSREDIAYQVCAASLRKHTSIPLEIEPIKQQALREQGLYWRGAEPLASTEFAFSRFLVPYLTGYQGWAVFMDCDFFWRGDIASLEDYMGDQAVYVVKHNYKPKEATKMDGAIQTVYPKKNWSSLMLINCGHPAVQKLTPTVVNTATGLYLHRFKWIDAALVGKLPITYNYLEGWYTGGDPLAVHFTRGGPWMPGYENVEYADEWRNMERECHG